MKKATGWFTGVIILLVVGATVTAWCLNDKGYIGNKQESPADNVGMVYDENRGDKDGNENIPYDDDKYENDDPADNERDEDKNEENNDSDDKDKENDVSPVHVNLTDSERANINEFLSIFSRVYFSQTEEYSIEKHNNYELIRFAFSHIRRTNNSAIITKQKDDRIGYYLGASYSDINKVLKEYLGVTVSRDSVYTENNYAFFEYENGCFYTPAADGIGYTNLTVADSVTANDASDSVFTVSFTIYSDGVTCDMNADEAAKNGEKYASGTAKIEKDKNGFILKSYKIAE